MIYYPSSKCPIHGAANRRRTNPHWMGDLHTGGKGSSNPQVSKLHSRGLWQGPEGFRNSLEIRSIRKERVTKLHVRVWVCREPWSAHGEPVAQWRTPGEADLQELLQEAISGSSRQFPNVGLMTEGQERETGYRWERSRLLSQGLPGK